MDSDRRFSRGSWAVLVFVLALLLVDAIQLAFRFTLPTDGWAVYTDSPDGEAERLFFYLSLIDGPSPLVSGDQLLALDDLPASEPSTLGLSQASALRAQWEAGEPIRYTLLRGGQMVTVEVLPRRWTFGAWWRGNAQSASTAAGLLVGPILAAVATFTFFKRPGNLGAQALFVLCAVIFANGLSSSLPDGVSTELYPFVRFASSFFSYAIFVVLLGPSLLTFTLVFPRPKAWLKHRRWLGLAPHGLGLAIGAAIFFGQPGILGWFVTMLMFVAALASVVHSGFTARDAISRAQMRWAVGGFGLGLAVALTTYLVVFGLVGGPIGDLMLAGGVPTGFMIIGISLAVAVLRYRLFDIDLIIRRTLVYTVLTAALALVYLGGVAILQSVFRALTAETSQLAVVASTLAIAALFSPLRRRVQDFIDRRFYRRKYDAAHTLAGFAATARDETDLDRLAERLVNVVYETMQPEHVSLWLRPGAPPRPSWQEAPGR